MFFYTEDLINSIKLRTMMPISQTTFQTGDLISLANEELQLKLVSDIQSIREDFFLTHESQNLVSGIDHYFIPQRAIGNAFKQLTWLDSQGNESAPLNRTTSDKAFLFASSNSIPVAYYIEADRVVLLPKPSISQGQIKIYFLQRPNQLVPTTSCAKITAISSSLGNTTLTVDTDLTGSLTTSNNADFLRTNSPFMLWAYEQPILSITGTTIQVASAGISDVNGVVLPGIGDYICPAKQCNIPQVPQEFHPVLAQMTACKVLEALGDLNKCNLAKATLNEMRKSSIDLIKNRVETSPTKVDTRGSILGRVGARYGLR